MAKWEEPAIMGLKRISRAERAGLAPLSCFRGSVALAPCERRGEAEKKRALFRATTMMVRDFAMLDGGQSSTLKRLAWALEVR